MDVAGMDDIIPALRSPPAPDPRRHRTAIMAESVDDLHIEAIVAFLRSKVPEGE
jgi:hypothetical protein